MPTHSGSKRVIAADLDGDRSLDIVTSNEASVSVLLNRGDGTFAPSQTILALPAMGRHRALVAADFNNDRTLDLAVTTEDWGGGPGATITVALGTGDGTFQPPREIPAPMSVNFMAAGDFDRDGSLDLALSNGALIMMRGLGDGGFAPPAMIYDGGSIEAGGVVVTDLDGDKILDLLSSNGKLLHHRGNGDGTFAAPLGLAQAGNPDFVADLNHDGFLDVVARGGGGGPPIGLGSTGVTLVLGRGNGAFDAPLYYPTGLSDSFEAATVADFDGNGLLDIAAPGGILLQRACAPSASTMR